MKDWIKRNQDNIKVTLATLATVSVVAYSIPMLKENRLLLKEHKINPAAEKPFQDTKWKYYFGFADLLCLGMLYNMIKSKSNPFKPDYTNIEKIQNKALGIGGGLMTNAVLWPISQYGDSLLKSEMMFAMGVAGYTLADMFHEEHVLKKRYKEAKSKGDLENKICNYFQIRELREKVHKQFRGKNYSEAAKTTVEITKRIRAFKDFEIEFIPTNVTPFIRYSNMYYAYKFHRSPNFNNALSLLISNTNIFSPRYEYHLENMKKLGIEFEVMGFEFETNEDKRRERGKKLYRKLDKLGKVNEISIQTANYVKIIECGCLEKHYASKTLDNKEMQDEILQTEKIKDGFSTDIDIIIPEIAISYDKNDFSELDDKGTMWISYKPGDWASDHLKKLDIDDRIILLKRLIDIDVKASTMGICNDVENLYEKVVSDIMRNEELSADLKNELKELMKINLKYADKLAPVMDVDAYLTNRLVAKDGKIVALDWARRKMSDPTYMLIKKLEHEGIFPLNEECFNIRNELIAYQLGKFNEECDETMLSHYYASVPDKTLSYYLYSKDKMGTRDIRLGYFESAEFSLDILLNNFEHLYTINERKGLIREKEIFREIKSNIDRAAI